MGEFSLKLFSTRIIVYFVPFCFRLLCFIEVCFYVWLFGFSEGEVCVCVCVCHSHSLPLSHSIFIVFIDLMQQHSVGAFHLGICQKYAKERPGAIHPFSMYVFRTYMCIVCVCIMYVLEIENYGPITNMAWHNEMVETKWKLFTISCTPSMVHSVNTHTHTVYTGC